MTQTPPISDEQVEAAARALYEADDVWSAALPWPSLTEGEAGADGYRRLACAALNAAASIPASRGAETEGRPANFAGWKGRLLDLTVEFDCIQVGPNPDEALSNAQAIVAEMLEGFDDVTETESALAALPAPLPVEEQGKTENLVLVPMPSPLTTTVLEGTTYAMMAPAVLRKALAALVKP